MKKKTLFACCVLLVCAFFTLTVSTEKGASLKNPDPELVVTSS